MNRKEALAAAVAQREAEAAETKKKKAITPMNTKRAGKSLEEKYPIGLAISVAYHHDDHFYDCIVTKHHNHTKVQTERGEEWVYVQFANDRSKHCIDLNIVKSITPLSQDVLTLKEWQNKKKTGNDYDGFIGQRIEVEWNDGNKYVGVATKMMKNNRYFVFMEYDDGDQCWCDLREEHDWNVIGIDDELNDDDDDDDIDDDDNGSNINGRNNMVQMDDDDDDDDEKGDANTPKKRKELFSSTDEEESEGDDDDDDDDDYNDTRTKKMKNKHN